MGPKAKREAPPKVGSKARALKAKKAVQKASTDTGRKRSARHHLPKTQNTAAQMPLEESPRRNRLHRYAVKFPLTTESALEREDNRTLCSVWTQGQHAQIQQAIKKLEVSCLIRPNGQKKASVWLSPD
ncbi:60S ribosomal protein L23a-like [Sorex araneus]|uniref:60S ribosomal protein L23a-like n=1 Tax=Sorex araneus TaxID=42254 RepID=UPI002433D25F|nr:60S ribosomal protein L23a-like [Sorex araneus]